MYKGGRIILFAGLFVLLMAVPLLVNLGNATAAPTPNVDTPAINALSEKQCVESTEYMRSSHMQLLDEWRNDVVRDGATDYKSASGQVYEISLDDTCLECHSNREEFCDSCHEYSSVELYCWDCHDLADAKQAN
ncbi:MULTISPECIES: sulfate reduction electron transfer complex DsrMKJOP subunit DsrJ [Gordonibacter]|uniref:Sulfate reduction electron transfer complex DsrMKJOP subunit DsrJ n=1 Tax=Gordonibacter faecis TaxID=3047475 RepID=A0ABT7DLB2_9ACTN|nr:MULTISPECIES: sulfate reduction electron transfer complex DsrMKJOP subunit DsrJ [unclassified Gordonibacter]MDJ1650323.1 sulfate reduction electron transfer complex DsrMKJOP subunit DsrJ [Gordonibacter sp. KGMB12511]HIW76831.1 sulfate reduction electron transfer complex DsrMKJOP subunit DsrJ [Candidatus Gordonibacter avicola]